MTDSRRPGTAAETDTPRTGSSGLLDKDALNFIALIACPLLAVVTAIMGLTMIVNGHVLAGLLFLLLLTQAFAIGGLVAWTRRRR
ncbi:NF038396 family protein [uncultured Micrococcus sp.]|uniref:NF038396 family protein n=1 Tax=uncultured Micrococcus sp. TaxID=114051 RepID=UPI002596C9EB|nr:NF038396 family protein [uncultured Micrococcus sp.]